METRTMFKFIIACYLFVACIILVRVHNLHMKTLFDEVKSDKKISTTENSLHRNNTSEIVKNLTSKKKDSVALFQFGPGLDGKKFEIPVNASKAKDRIHKKHDFNTFISDLIGYHRSLGDCRPSECKTVQYTENLPQACIVVLFRDEYPSIVMRTAYSVLEASPHLVKEVILMDDGSTDEDMRLTAEIHAANVDKFKYVRNEKPLGLMMGRQKGIEACTADYFVVMDGHMEVCHGWLEPIIHRLIQEPKALLSPWVGAIDRNSFEFNIGDVVDSQFMYLSQITLGQAWVLYNENFRKTRKSIVEPVPFGAMQGMIMAMRKDFFLKLGGFDPEMRVWGAEQMEISVKVWMCGGRVEVVPCSRVGHMFRTTKWGGTIDKVNHIAINRARFAAVWLDDGAQRDAILALQKKKGGVPGDVEDRLRIRRENNCHSYKYFLDKIREFADIYVPVNIKRYGVIRNNLTSMCIDINQISKDKPKQVVLYYCHSSDNQFFFYTDKSQIRYDQHIIFTNPNDTNLLVTQTNLEFESPESLFTYTDDKTIVQNTSGFCITALKEEKVVQLKTCDGSPYQQFDWGPMP